MSRHRGAVQLRLGCILSVSNKKAIFCLPTSALTCTTLLLVRSIQDQNFLSGDFDHLLFSLCTHCEFNTEILDFHALLNCIVERPWRLVEEVTAISRKYRLASSTSLYLFRVSEVISQFPSISVWQTWCFRLIFKSHRAQAICIGLFSSPDA